SSAPTSASSSTGCRRGLRWWWSYRGGRSGPPLCRMRWRRRRSRAPGGSGQYAPRDDGARGERMKKIRTLVVDDEPLARERLTSLLSAEADIDLVGQCRDGEEAVTAIMDHSPDLVFL